MEKQQFRHPIEQLNQVAEEKDLVFLQNAVKSVYVDNLVKQYIAAVVESTRHHPAIYMEHPARIAGAFSYCTGPALLQGRDYVLPDDVKALAEPVLSHRIIVNIGNNGYDNKGRAVIADILQKVPVPERNRAVKLPHLPASRSTPVFLQFISRPGRKYANNNSFINNSPFNPVYCSRHR